MRGSKSRDRGAYAEKEAETYLKRRGLEPVTCNFSSRHGEIDLIMMHGDVLVFIEVRYRADVSHGLPVETVDSRKREKLIKTAQYYLQKHFPAGEPPSRFDVLGLHTDADGDVVINWIENAF